MEGVKAWGVLQIPIYTNLFSGSSKTDLVKNGSGNIYFLKFKKCLYAGWNYSLGNGVILLKFIPFTILVVVISYISF